MLQRVTIVTDSHANLKDLKVLSGKSCTLCCESDHRLIKLIIKMKKSNQLEHKLHNLHNIVDEEVSELIHEMNHESE